MKKLSFHYRDIKYRAIEYIENYRDSFDYQLSTQLSCPCPCSSHSIPVCLRTLNAILAFPLSRFQISAVEEKIEIDFSATAREWDARNSKQRHDLDLESELKFLAARSAAKWK